MSVGKLFHNRGPAVAKTWSPTVLLHSVSGGHPADGSVMTADVAWMACQTTVGGLQPFFIARNEVVAYIVFVDQ